MEFRDGDAAGGKVAATAALAGSAGLQLRGWAPWHSSDFCSFSPLPQRSPDSAMASAGCS